MITKDLDKLQIKAVKWNLVDKQIRRMKDKVKWHSMVHIIMLIKKYIIHWIQAL